MVTRSVCSSEGREQTGGDAHLDLGAFCVPGAGLGMAPLCPHSKLER